MKENPDGPFEIRAAMTLQGSSCIIDSKIIGIEGVINVSNKVV